MFRERKRKVGRKMDIKEVRALFPALQAQGGCYLDNAATTHKPQCVIDALSGYYAKDNANVYRGGYRAARKSEAVYACARKGVAEFIGAAPEEIIFTGGTTGAINTVAYGYALGKLETGKNIVVTALEHSSNFLPWQEMCRKTGAKLEIIPFDQKKGLDLDAAAGLITKDTVLTACTLASNVLDQWIPVKELIGLAHSRGCPVLVDAAQAIAHQRIDCRQLEADFLCFSGHKAYGPMGIGALYASRRIQEDMELFLTGGGMTREADGATAYLKGPARWEAGTPDVAGAAGLNCALCFLEEIGIGRISAYEEELKYYARERLGSLDGLTVLGDGSGSAPLVSFYTEQMHSYDLAACLSVQNICVRTGKHCAYELMRSLGIAGCVRVSFGLYNTKEEIDMLAEWLAWILRKYGRKKG